MDDALILAAAVVAGAINAIAGGGTLVTFPTLVWLGVPSVQANATNTVALWPGSVSSAWGYRREMSGAAAHVWTLVGPSLAGGLVGAILLRLTPTTVFDRLVPALILFATILFMLQDRVQRLILRRSDVGAGAVHLGAAPLVYQLLVGIYGGYFGAGIGILMLAVLAVMGYTDIHQMNGLKNVLAAAINGLAAVYFTWVGLVSWPHVGVMAVGAISGGMLGAALARRMGRDAVRRAVVTIGFAMALSLMLRR